MTRPARWLAAVALAITAACATGQGGEPADVDAAAAIDGAGGGAIDSAGNDLDAAPSPGAITLTQNASMAITDANSINCNDTITTGENSYYRAFALSDEGLSGAFAVSRVDFAVETASSELGSQAVEVRIHRYTGARGGATLDEGAMTQIGTATGTVADMDLGSVSVPVTALVPDGSAFVVEIYSPDGDAAGASFFIGTNTAAEDLPSYIRAPDPGCEVDEPTTFASITDETVSIILTVTGSY